MVNAVCAPVCRKGKTKTSFCTQNKTGIVLNYKMFKDFIFLQAEAEVVPSSSLVEVEVRLVLRLRLGLRLDELRCN